MADIKQYVKAAEEKMTFAIEYLDEQLSHIRAGKANPKILDCVRVMYYGAPVPLTNVATVTVPDARTIMITPWEKKIIKDIEKGIMDSEVGITPENNGEVIRLGIPPLTEERRRLLAKQSKQEAETAKISIRNARRDAIEQLKKSIKTDGTPEDVEKDAEAEVQKVHDKYIKKVDELYAAKEKESDGIDPFFQFSTFNFQLSINMRGLVIKNTGSWYTVRTDDGRDIESKIKGNFRLKEIRTTNPVAVGDRVDIDINAEGTAFITKIEDRKNYIIRRASNLSKQSHIIAANVDQAMLIVTVNYPITTTVFIDRFLATAEAYRVPVKLVFNKIDRYHGGDRELLDDLVNLYTTIGYPCSMLCARTEEGLDVLKEDLKGRITLLSGHSGVGKSTIINKLIPGVNLRTGDISEYHNKGMHTTTFSEMIPLLDGGYLIDTPGIKGFGTIEMEGAEIAHYFPEIFKFSADCRFNNCSHRHEPGCAVLRAVEEHCISESRYKSYLSILDDKQESKYREEY